MIAAAWPALVLAALLVLPGAGLAKALRLPTAVALASGPAVTLGVVGCSTLLLGFTPIRWNLVTALLALLFFGGLAVLGGRRWPPPEQGARMSRRSLAVVAAGVLVGAGVFSFTCLRWLELRTSRGLDNISQVWDALWHANLIRFIAETGVASPIRTGELINSDNHSAHFYPDAWHALVALVEPLTGAVYPRLYNLASVVTPAVVVPVSAAALAWRLLRDRLDERFAAYGASVAAAASALFPSLYEEEAFGSVPSAVAVALAPVVVVLAMSCLVERRRLPVAALAFAGVTATHPSAAVVVAVALLLWWATRLIWRPIRSRAGDFLTLGAIPVAAAALLAPMGLGLKSASSETGAFVFYWYDLSVSHAQAALRTVGLVTRTADESVPFEHRAHLMLPLVAVAALGLIATIFVRQWWAAATWAVFALVATNDWKPFGQGICVPGPICGPTPLVNGRPSMNWTPLSFPWFLDEFSGSFYHDPHRLAEVLTLFAMGFVGVGAGAGLFCADWLLRRARLPERRAGWASAVGFWLVVVLVVGYAEHVRVERGALANSSRDDHLVGLADVKAYHWLAGQPGARDTVILNNLDQGSGWMYAEAGLKPMFAHYRSPDWSADQNCVFWFVASAGRDWRVADALRRLRVRYVYESPPSYWPDFPDPFVFLIGQEAHGIKPIYHDGKVTIYELADLATRHDQEDPVVSADKFHFCRG